MATSQELLQAVDDVISDGVRRGMLHNVAEDTHLDGREITIGGRRLVNFGSCSYLGLETHPLMKAAVAEATERYGTQFSSSRAYVSAPPYAEAESLMAELFGRPAIITSSTTMGHVAALPTLIDSEDVLILDHQVHHSVQTAAKLVQAQGTQVRFVRHSDMGELEQAIRDLSRSHHRLWYAADGLYSMYADFAPMDELETMLARYKNLWLYIDDAHAVSWTGRHGRGHALDRLSPAAQSRCVVAGSLNKSFAAAGGVLTFPDDETRRRAFTVGGPLIFSGPVQPPMLGSIVASARLHMSEEVASRQAYLLRLIRLFNRLAAENGLPLVSRSEAPIRCIGAGVPPIAYNLTARLRDAGYFADTATFPAVAAKRSGARVTLTAHHTEEDVEAVVEALAEALPKALADEGGSVSVLERSFARQLRGRRVRLRGMAADDTAPATSPTLRLERHTTIDTVDRDEWDALLGHRGAFSWHGLRAIEEVFAGRHDRPEHSWDFNYWIVRDPLAGDRPVAATFFTTTLWKDDMLSSAELSAVVEQLRAEDPYHLTSTVVGMGSLITEGDHLYLDRDADWRSALRLILQAAREEEERAGATGVTLRDIPEGDGELHDFLISEGFAGLAVPVSWTREIDFTDNEGFLAGLPSKARHHQRTKVLDWEERYRVDVISADAHGTGLTEAELDHLYGLYRQVHARGLLLNVFPLPRHILDTVIRHPEWELIVLRLVDGPADPVAFVVQHVAGDHVQPLFLGLDYDYVASHGCYQQVLWQAVRSAQRHGARRVLFGMSADRHKARFGSTCERRRAYVQATKTYNLDVLSRLAGSLGLAG